MQFLPTTWTEPASAPATSVTPTTPYRPQRVTGRRGGLQDIRRGLWGYNNSDYYGRAVLLYASLIGRPPCLHRALSLGNSFQCRRRRPLVARRLQPRARSRSGLPAPAPESRPQGPEACPLRCRNPSNEAGRGAGTLPPR
ncbi:MAG: hypothetical protein CM15mP77_0450 [Synechococcus sp.]|nr:MAG: hypothetical protein CM15mP77_0450 [Synechococcus sp.]